MKATYIAKQGTREELVYNLAYRLHMGWKANKKTAQAIVDAYNFEHGTEFTLVVEAVDMSEARAYRDMSKRFGKYTAPRNII